MATQIFNQKILTIILNISIFAHIHTYVHDVFTAFKFILELTTLKSLFNEMKSFTFQKQFNASIFLFLKILYLEVL